MTVPADLSRRLFVGAVSVLCCLAVLGCPSGAPKGGFGKESGVLRYPMTAEPTTLDPARVSDGPTIDVLQNVHIGLVGWNEKTEVVPLAAAEMPKVSADGKVYTFTLRDGLKFHNGREVTADDVRYSLTRALSKELNSPVAMSYLNDIVGAEAVADGKAKELQGVEAVDPRTIRITLVAPRPYFLGKLTYPTGFILAKEEVDKGPAAPGGTAPTISETNMAGVGCGPFRLASYTPQDKLVLEAFGDYALGAPKLKRIERPIVLDSKAARTLYDTGQIDLVTLEKADYEKDASDPALKDQIKTFNRAATYYLGLNQTHYGPFADRRVRQAFAHAIDKDSIVKTVLLGINRKAEGVVPEGLPGYQEDFKGYPFDPSKAKALLSEAGYGPAKPLPPLTLVVRQQQSDLIKAAQMVKEQLATVGVEVNLKEMEWGAFLQATDNKEIDFFHMRWMADYPDPQNFLSLLLMSGAPENRTGYANAAFDALCRQADSLLDPKARLGLYAKAERMVVDDAPWIPLYYQRDVELIKPHVGGLADCLQGHLPHVTTSVD
jgi:oligopeptide transport system substrate-binding protein